MDFVTVQKYRENDSTRYLFTELDPVKKEYYNIFYIFVYGDVEDYILTEIEEETKKYESLIKSSNKFDLVRIVHIPIVEDKKNITILTDTLSYHENRLSIFHFDHDKVNEYKDSVLYFYFICIHDIMFGKEPIICIKTLYSHNLFTNFLDSHVDDHEFLYCDKTGVKGRIQDYFNYSFINKNV